MGKFKTFVSLIKREPGAIKIAISDNFARSRVSHLLPDKIFLKIRYKSLIGKRLNLKNPRTYNEKLQWLKLYDRKPEYTKLVDKYEVKQYVANLIGGEYIIPTLAVWDNAEDLDIDALPNRFVLKCTHDSGSILICKNKEEFDLTAAKTYFKNKRAKNMFWWGREWPYKHVRPRIIAEQYMEDSITSELRDYKFFCFNGEPKLMFIATDRQNKNKETAFDFFDLEYNHLPIKNGHPFAEFLPEKPKNFEKMVELSKKLSVGIPHVRVDFYEVDDRIYFGEMTFFQNSGMVSVEPPEWDLKMGRWIDLEAVAQK